MPYMQTDHDEKPIYSPRADQASEIKGLSRSLSTSERTLTCMIYVGFAFVCWYCLCICVHFVCRALLLILSRLSALCTYIHRHTHSRLFKHTGIAHTKIYTHACTHKDVHKLAQRHIHAITFSFTDISSRGSHQDTRIHTRTHFLSPRR